MVLYISNFIMSIALYRLFPIDILNIIYEYSREKTTVDYKFQHYKSANQLFYYYNQPEQSNSISHHFWTYDMWIKPNHPTVKALEIRVDYDKSDKPMIAEISLADKSCFRIKGYLIKEGWALAFHPKYKAFTIKQKDALDVWELTRWNKFLQNLMTSAYLDIFWMRRLLALQQN